jgi:hypothetical protein
MVYSAIPVVLVGHLGHIWQIVRWQDCDGESADIYYVGNISLANGVIDSSWTARQTVQRRIRLARDLREKKLSYCKELLCLKDCFSPCIC